MTKYEVAVLYHPDLEVDLTKSEERVKKIFTDAGGKVVSTDNWGKRKLAYPIKKQDYAVYVFYTVEVPGESLAKIETTLNITDEVVRYLITRPDEKAIAKAEKIKDAQAKRKAAGVEEREDEDDDSDDE